MAKGDIENATIKASKAKEQGHPQADRLLAAVRREEVKAAPVDTSKIEHRVNEKEYKENRNEIRRRLRRSRQLYTTGELDKALEECELVLRDNPYNHEAMVLRNRIADRMHDVSNLEFEATRSMMIRNVRDTWNDKRYAVDSEQIPTGKSDLTTKQSADTGKSAEQIVRQKLTDIVIPEVTFRPPATIIDAVDFFKIASRDFDKPEIPVEQRGVNLVLKLPAATGSTPAPAAAEDDVFGSTASATPAGGAGGVPVIPAMTARFINLYDALKLVCDVTGMKFRIRGNIVMIVPMNDPDSELISRSYNVLSSVKDRIATAQSEFQTSDKQEEGGLGGAGLQTVDMNGGSGGNWKKFFENFGVQWPEGSSIGYSESMGKVYVKNTAEQLAIFEEVLEGLNVTPRLIEVEARFVEVSQADLNSLGFEWLLNSDFSFDAGGFLDHALNLKEHSNAMGKYIDANGNEHKYFLPYTKPGQLKGIPIFKDINGEQVLQGYRMNNGRIVDPATFGALAGQYGVVGARRHNASIDAIDGNKFSTGNRFLDTEGNPVAGENVMNDKFMRINAFLGNADLSMILHMLSQRSDTDVLSAPKVVTKSGQEAIMKVVTEYIYPTEFEVEISQQSVSGGDNTSSGMTLATVEPQNFEMREVGVILQVIPEVTPDGQMIDLLLVPQVVSEPTWKNYGMKIPYFAPSKGNFAGAIGDATGLDEVLAPSDVEYMELPMEQPFFSVRSVQTKLSVYNGATVVMGGLITENRTTIEDKVPFLGDIPYVGRLFRSKAESSEKRNLLVFVTALLVDPAGRAIKVSGESSLLSSMEGGAAPAAQAEAPAQSAN